MRKEITVKRSYLITDHGTFPLDELTPEQLAEASRVMSDRVRRTMRDYYMRHPEEYAKLPDAPH